ncbi:nuclear transport factor 2 family protein [Paludibacterium yongneupense]|uniref:nuclear transport factor 2 family protein n=1 Tax=Paludibacterium yongneupense TaxID=400061 RepID=UPI001FEBFBF8|nr:nuclear transport factor 2 family protein [Paludibacterium yongneupense]
MNHESNRAIARQFHAALIKGDWAAIRALLSDDAKWILPGDNTISSPAQGAEAIVERAQKIAGYQLEFELLHILSGPKDAALHLHNTAERGDIKLDEYLATILRIEDGKIIFIETFLSDVAAMNTFFV